MATIPTNPNQPVKPIIIGPLIGIGRLSAEDSKIDPEIAQALKDIAAKEQRKLELLLLVARLRELVDRKNKLEIAAAPMKPKPTPQYLQLNGEIAQIAKKLSQQGVYSSPEEAVQDAKKRYGQPFTIEQFHGQPIIGIESRPLRYTLYTAMWGAEAPKIINRVEQALANAAARRPQRPARNQK